MTQGRCRQVSATAGGNMAGSLGECADFNVLFYVYVPKKMKEQAQETIAAAQHEFSLQRY